MALKIRNGQFVDESGNVVKPEFGNREMIDAVKKEELRLKDLEKGIPCEVLFEEIITYEMEIRFKCGNCLKPMYKSIESETESDYEMRLADKKIVICRHCNTEHKLKHIKAENEIRAIIEK